MTATALRGHHSTEPLAVDRDTNTTSSPEVDTLDAYLAEVREQLRADGQRISRSGLRRLYWRWLETAQTDFDFGRFVLAYADPTGDTATSRVFAEQMARRHS